MASPSLRILPPFGYLCNASTTNPLVTRGSSRFKCLKSMKTVCILALLTFVLAGSSLSQDKVFDWVRANQETLQLDPTDYHTGRVYRPGPDGGDIHVGIESKQPITIAMTWIEDWNNALQHPETMVNLTLRCLREHVVSTTYECHLPPQRPMVLLMHDERTPDRAIVTGIGAVLGHGVGARQFISPNEVQVQYYSWTCVQNCIQPQFQWFRLVKEKYEITSVPKIYNLLTPERDGQQLSVKIKASIPVTVAVVPQQFADQVYDNPGALSSTLSKTTCKQRGVQSLSFECTFNQSDGPQSIIVLPDSAAPSHKKAEIELQTVKCVANCRTTNDQ